MKKKSESVAKSSIRAFFVSAFSVAGIAFGIILAIMMIGMAGGEGKPKTKTSYEVVPDALGKLETLKDDSSLILELDIKGIIGAEEVNATGMRRVLDEVSGTLFDTGRIKGILLTINTPGGTVFDADSIYRLLTAFKKEHQIPVFAHINGLCASGGVYVAAAADRVYATDVSVIGSVGVVLNTFLNFSELLNKVGISTVTLAAGEGKDVMNPLRPWQPGEEEQLRTLTDFYYEQFVDIVANNRPNLDRDQLVNTYGAKIFPAPLAKQYGFIDESGTSHRNALERLVEAADIDPGNYQVVKVATRHWWDTFAEGQWNTLFQGKVSHEVQWIPGLDNKFLNQPMYLYYPGLAAGA